MASSLHANDLGVAFVEFFAGFCIWISSGGELPGQCKCRENYNGSLGFLHPLPLGLWGLPIAAGRVPLVWTELDTEEGLGAGPWWSFLLSWCLWWWLCFKLSSVWEGSASGCTPSSLRAWRRPSAHGLHLAGGRGWWKRFWVTPFASS